jgi:anti-anti-sigma factor
MYDPSRNSQQPVAIELGRDIDLAGADPLGERLCQAIDCARGDIVVDLSGVRVINSRGLAMMARVHQHARARDRSVTWRGLQAWLPRLLEINGLDPASPRCCERQNVPSP